MRGRKRDHPDEEEIHAEKRGSPALQSSNSAAESKEGTAVDIINSILCFVNIWNLIRWYYAIFGHFLKSLWITTNMRLGSVWPCLGCASTTLDRALVQSADGSSQRSYSKALVVMQVYFQWSDVLKTLKQKQSKVGFKWHQLAFSRTEHWVWDGQR